MGLGNATVSDAQAAVPHLLKNILRLNIGKRTPNLYAHGRMIDRVHAPTERL
jgi:hypothetical protein